MDNKVALVTGSSFGIGRATITEFAKNGYNVVINYVKSEKEAFALQQELEEKYHIIAMVCQADVSDEKQVKTMINDVVQKFGKIDALVNNAGIICDRPFQDITLDECKRIIDVNVLGSFIVSRAAEPYLHGGCIVNISSTAGTKVVAPDCLDYNITKIGLQSLTRDLAFQFRPDIRVNAVAPGWVDTRMNADLPETCVQEAKEKIYLKRFAKPEEIAHVIYFLCSDQASYINGEVINVDGGY